jgi:16S rRNA (guanine527-N7)-methyltransferase
VQGVNPAASRHDAARVLVAEGLDVLPALPTAGALVDLGSGAGVPGLLIALSRPAARVVLVEASRKKAGFLEIAVRDLSLPNVEIVCARAESLGRDPEHRGRYDAVTARAVADLRVLVEYALPLLRMGGVAVLPKGKMAAQELATASHALEVLGGTAELRSSGGARAAAVVVVRKVAPTPAEYPRRPGIPERRPIG